MKGISSYSATCSCVIFVIYFVTPLFQVIQTACCTSHPVNVQWPWVSGVERLCACFMIIEGTLHCRWCSVLMTERLTALWQCCVLCLEIKPCRASSTIIKLSCRPSWRLRRGDSVVYFVAVTIGCVRCSSLDRRLIVSQQSCPWWSVGALSAVLSTHVLRPAVFVTVGDGGLIIKDRC